MENKFAKSNILLLEIAILCIMAAIMFSVQGDSFVSTIVAVFACVFSVVCIIIGLFILNKKS